MEFKTNRQKDLKIMMTEEECDELSKELHKFNNIVRHLILKLDTGEFKWQGRQEEEDIQGRIVLSEIKSGHCTFEIMEWLGLKLLRKLCREVDNQAFQF